MARRIPMRRAVTGTVAFAGVLVLAACLRWPSSERTVAAAFWFDEEAFHLDRFEVERLRDPLTPHEKSTIASTAQAELRSAYAGLRIVFSDRRDARYQIRVVRHLRNPLVRGMNTLGIAGESRVVWPARGFGAVSFGVLAGNAVAYAPPEADRGAIIEAIGRGIGRAAAHEFAHLLLPTKPLHASTDVTSYEYPSAGRAEQYYGPMHWGLAWPLLVDRLGVTASSSSSSAQ